MMIRGIGIHAHRPSALEAYRQMVRQLSGVRRGVGIQVQRRGGSASRLRQTIESRGVSMDSYLIDCLL